MFQTGMKRREEGTRTRGWMAVSHLEGWLSKTLRGTGAKTHVPTHVWYRQELVGLGSRRGPDGVTAIISGSRISAINLTN